jgi:V/A-type H+-transporting ATPase subunit I
MFFPKTMTEVELIVPAKDLVAVTKVLGSRESFHQIDSTYLGVESLGPNTWQETAASYSTLERRIQAIMQTLGLEEAYAGSPSVDSTVDLSAVQAAVERIEAEVKATGDQLNSEKKNLEQFESQLHQLEPIADLNVDVGALRNSKYLYSVPGIMPKDSESRLETSLARVPHVFLNLRDDPKKPVVWVLGPRSNSDVIDRAIRSAYLNPLTLPEEFKGTPADITKQLSRAIETSRQKIAELERALAKLADTHKKELYKLWGEVHVNRVMADAIARFGQLRHTYVVVGWVPATELESLTQRLKQASKEILIEVVPVELTGHQSNVPVALQNPKFLSSFELMVNTYARPRYNEIDPTILITLTFPLLYGAMFGDVGHGLVLAAFGWLLSSEASKRLPSILRDLRSLAGLVIACGLSGTIFGFIYGSVFGFEEVLPHLIKPSENILTILGIAVGAGMLLLNVAILLNLYNAFRVRDWGRFFFDSNGLAGWILYLSFLVIFVQGAASLLFKITIFPSYVVVIAGVLMAITTLLAVVFSHPLQHWMETGHFEIEGSKVIFGVQSFFEVLEKFISMFSNTLSYVRVGAFAIVHAGFTGAVFIIAKLVGGGHEAGFGYWTVVVLGNLFVILLEAFIVTIQTMRLHFYEFFSKFFQGGGSPYEPLALAPAQEK